MDGTYLLTFEEWEELGCPEEVDLYVIDQTDEGFVLAGFPDADSNGVPDFLQSISGGGDITLNPSQGVVVG